MLKMNYLLCLEAFVLSQYRPAIQIKNSKWNTMQPKYMHTMKQ